MIVLRSSAALAVITLASMNVAHAADLARPKAEVAMPAPSAVWTGSYLGVNIGYGDGVISAPNHAGFDISGLSVGGQAGYNLDLGSGFVAGVQIDADWSNATGGNGVWLEGNNNWSANLTGHIGYAAGDFMPYALAGVSVLSATGTVTQGPVGTDTEIATGWTIGAGIEAMVADHTSAFAEYRYTYYGPTNFTVAGITNPQTDAENSVRVGLNFHF